jgi:hypothetical protein
LRSGQLAEQQRVLALLRQLDAILRTEDAGLDETVVASPWHSPERKRWCLHGCRPDTATATITAINMVARSLELGPATRS